MNKNIAILMSTYNGERYIKDQINSIINQTFKEWTLYIRDDGSNDKTVKLIKEFAKKDSRIIFLENISFNNLGPAVSFLTMLRLIDADFYFFADQDDYWDEAKIAHMLKKIDPVGDYPQLVYSNLQVVNKDLTSITSKWAMQIGKSKGKTRFFVNDVPGCTMLINKQVRQMFVKTFPDYKKIIMHDWWLVLIAQSFGKVVFLDEKLVLYRQHGNNTVGTGEQNRNSVLKKIFNKNSRQIRKKNGQSSIFQSMEFFNMYHSDLTQEDRIFFKDVGKLLHSSFVYKVNFLNKYKIYGDLNLRNFYNKILFIEALSLK